MTKILQETLRNAPELAKDSRPLSVRWLEYLRRRKKYYGASDVGNYRDYP